MFHSESQVKSGIMNVQKQINYANNSHLGTVLCFCKGVPGHPKHQPFCFVRGAQTQLGPQRREASCKRKDFGNCTRKSSFCAPMFSGHIFLHAQFSYLRASCFGSTKFFRVTNQHKSKRIHTGETWSIYTVYFLWSWPKPTQPGNPTAICGKKQHIGYCSGEKRWTWVAVQWLNQDLSAPEQPGRTCSSYLQEPFGARVFLKNWALWTLTWPWQAGMGSALLAVPPRESTERLSGSRLLAPLCSTAFI